MSVQDLPSDLETTPEPDERVVRRLVRAIDYAEGFWLGFAKSNTPAQRRRLAALCRDLLEPLRIRVLEIELTEPVTDLLPVLRERLAQEKAANEENMRGEEAATTTRPKLAIFVHGLERSIPSREAYPPLLSSLNLKRELFRQEVPHPLLLWLPDYALTALARKAPDFWAWRSGLYEFAPERESTEQSLEAVRDEAIHVTNSFSEQAKRERLVMLKGLLEDYRELGHDLREQMSQANILNDIGLMHEMLGEWDMAKKAYEESLIVRRNIQNEAGIAVALHNLGRVAQHMKDTENAKRLYNESLNIRRKFGEQYGISLILGQLGVLAQELGDFQEARRLYDESLEISNSINDQRNVATTLHELGRLSRRQRDFKEARRLYSESLEIKKRIADQNGIALTLNNFGILAEEEGDRAEAGRLYREALVIFERLGSPFAKITRQNLARLEVYGDISD